MRTVCSLSGEHFRIVLSEDRGVVLCSRLMQGLHESPELRRHHEQVARNLSSPIRNSDPPLFSDAGVRGAVWCGHEIRDRLAHDLCELLGRDVLKSGGTLREDLGDHPDHGGHPDAFPERHRG